MRYGNTFLRVMALLCLLLLLVSNADSQMNRDSPTLGSKIPKTSDESIFAQARGPGSSFVISQPFNGQASSDLSLSADMENTTCSQAAFRVINKLDPVVNAASGYQTVKVRLLDNSFGTAKALAELNLIMSALGGSVHETIGFMEATSLGKNQTRQITVMIDPDNEIKETNEGNNILILNGSC